jgi:glycosyltransferase involved in cell wall biosynthesis
VILSNLTPGAGGRETWCYSFLPTLLAAEPQMELRVYGLRTDDQPDTRPELLAAMAPEDRPRLRPLFFRTSRGRAPLFFAMARHLRRHMASAAVAPPRYVVAAGSIFEHLMVLASAKLRRSFRIVWLRCIFFDEKSDKLPAPLLAIARRVEGWLLARSDLLIANGDDIADYYRGRFGLHVHVIRNGIDAKRWRAPPPALDGPVTIAFVGRLTLEKGIGAFLDLARRLRGAGEAARFAFHVVGAEGPYEGEVRAAAAEGLLTYHGAVPNSALPGLLASFDVCVALTRVARDKGGGGTSNAMLEQMASGRVMLAWDNAIFRQVLDDRTAFMVEQDDVEGLAAALREIAAAPEAARTRASAAQAAATGHSLEAQLGKFLGLLNDRLPAPAASLASPKGSR